MEAPINCTICSNNNFRMPNCSTKIDDIFPQISVASDTLTTRLNLYQLLASGLDVKTAADLADAAAFKRSITSHGDCVLAGLPIPCPHLAELLADFQEKVMSKTVKALHNPPQAKCGKPADPPDNDDTDLLHTQFEKPSQSLTPRSSRPVLPTQVTRIPAPGTPRTRTRNAPPTPRRQTNLSHPPRLRQLTPTEAFDLQC